MAINDQSNAISGPATLHQLKTTPHVILSQSKDDTQANKLNKKSPGHNTRGFSKNLSVQPTLVLSQSLKSRLVQVETRTHRSAKSHLLDQLTLHTLRLSPKNRRVNARKII